MPIDHLHLLCRSFHVLRLYTGVCCGGRRQVRLVADEAGRFGHPLLREASVLALAKFMCISEAFCDRNLSLLFTTLERSKDTAVSKPKELSGRKPSRALRFAREWNFAALLILLPCLEAFGHAII